MSNPPNLLASFRSYSYYHVLAMCDCSQTADALAKSTDLNVWNHATKDTRIEDLRPQTQDLGPYSPKKINGGGNYIILINGSTDASYVIESAKWTTATGASAVPGDRSTSIAVEGSLKVSEPKGVAFLDQVIKCCVALGVDSAQVVYVLKTFFVGHLDGRQPTPDSGVMDHEFIADINPVNFIVYDVSGSFTESGGSYEMQFVGAAHGATRLPQYSKAVNSMSVTAGDSLQQTLINLQDNINKGYNQYYNCVVEQVKAMQGDAGSVAASLRPVKYVIEVGKDYTGQNEKKYTVTNQVQQYKNTAGCGDPAQVTFPAHTSIESAINTIMMMSPQVQADMAVGDTATQVKYEYKIHSALVSKPVGSQPGEIDYTVYYRVERFMTPKAISYNSAFDILQKDDDALRSDPVYAAIRRNIIEFDYMYTGKNIDILEFDMKVNMGMAYLQTATIANTFKSQLEPGPNKVMQPSMADLNSHTVRFGAGVPTPVFFGSQIKAPSLINTQNAGHAIQTAYTLTKHASLEVTDVSMKIIGNTQILGSANATTSPIAVESGTVSDYKKANERGANFADWSRMPAYVKVKIKMPRSNDDFFLFSGQTTSGDPSTDPGVGDYARDFWFDGYYYVVSVDHVFDNGEFYQVLQMLGLPKRSAFQAAQATATQEAKINTSVGTCFDNAIGISPQTTTTTPTVPYAPVSGTDPTTRNDAATANASANDPSQVKGWDTASPQVKEAIRIASERYGVDATIMAQFAYRESSFNPTASAAPRSSATGLYQFLQGTWNGLIKQGKVAGVTQLSTAATHQGSGSSWSKPLATDPRMDPYANALAGAAFLKENAATIGSSSAGDLYLAHFLGPGSARKIIASDKLTGGHLPMSVVLGSDTMNRIIAANPTEIKSTTTVGEVRAWAERKMAGSLKNPIAVADQRKPQATTGTTQGQSSPSSNPQNTKKTAADSVAAVQNTKIQEAKKDANPCGPTPNTVQDRPTRGGQ